MWSRKVMVIPVIVRALKTLIKDLDRGLKESESRKVRNHPDQSIEIGKNTVMSPGNQKSFVVTRNLLKDHHLTLWWKPRKKGNNNNNNNNNNINCHKPRFGGLWGAKQLFTSFFLLSFYVDCVLESHMDRIKDWHSLYDPYCFVFFIWKNKMSSHVHNHSMENIFAEIKFTREFAREFAWLFFFLSRHFLLFPLKIFFLFLPLEMFSLSSFWPLITSDLAVENWISLWGIWRIPF